MYIPWLTPHTESPKIWDWDPCQLNARDIYSVTNYAARMSREKN